MTVVTRSFLLLAIALLVGCGERSGPPAPAQPNTLPAAEIATIAAALPSYAHFSISGVAFVNDRLYVSTNIGLIELQGIEVKGLHRWYDKFNVISGPWADPPRAAVWAHRADDGYFVRRDSNGWLRIDLPKPSKGYYSRGDFLEGFSAASNADYFRLIGAGNVWRWNDSREWMIEPAPPAEEFSGVVGFGSMDNRTVYIVRKGVCALTPCDYLAYWREAERWSDPLHVPVGRVSQVVSTSTGVFLRSTKGELLRIEPTAVVRIETPSACEAITRTSEGKLLASFKGAGVFALEQRWIKLIDDPYPASEGEHWAYLAEGNGVIALATASVPHLKPGTDDQWTYTGTDALWVSDGKKLMRVELLKQ